MENTMAPHTRGGRSDMTVAGRLAGWLVIALAFSACDDAPEVVTFEPITDPQELFMSVTLEHRAINLSTAAPYDTFRLAAVPRNGLGEPISGLPAPTFRAFDDSRIQVTPDGLIKALRPTDYDRPALIVAEIVAENNIMHADTAFVHITDDPNPPRIQSLRISSTPIGTGEVQLPNVGAQANAFLLNVLHLTAGIPIDETTYIASDERIVPEFLDESGHPVITGSELLAVDFRSSNPDALGVGRGKGVLHPYNLEEARITARSVVYGVEVIDSVDLRVALPTIVGIVITEDEQGNLRLETEEVNAGPNALVLWLNTSETRIDIVFDRPDVVTNDPGTCSRLGGEFCGHGNIDAFEGVSPNDLINLFDPNTLQSISNALRLRRFPEPGVYDYHSPSTGLSGRLVVNGDWTQPSEIDH